jgi:hypothetical protein
MSLVKYRIILIYRFMMICYSLKMRFALFVKACLDTFWDHAFILFVFDTFGFLTPEVVDLLKRVQRVVHNNIISLISMNLVFRRLGFTIPKV